MIFQSIDDKSECIGVYASGQLHFDNFPADLTHTWKYTGSLEGKDIEYAWLMASGRRWGSRPHRHGRCSVLLRVEVAGCSAEALKR